MEKWALDVMEGGQAEKWLAILAPAHSPMQWGILLCDLTEQSTYICIIGVLIFKGFPPQ